MGHTTCSAPLLGMCCEHGVGISYLSEQGRFLARVTGPVSGNVLLRRQQYKMSDGSAAALAIVRAILTAKIANSRSVLLRSAREAQGEGREQPLRNAAQRMASALHDVFEAASIDEARGHEGLAGQVYFSAFNAMIGNPDERFEFHGRSRRPPLDRVNAMLSFVYALLRHDIESALEVVGLDPAVGFLHTDRPGRPSLALDLMEEFRSALADRVVLSLINKRQINPAGFRIIESAGVEMDDGTRKQIVAAWQTRKQEEIEHPFLKEKIAIGLIPYSQAMLLGRFIRGGLDAYPAFFWR